MRIVKTLVAAIIAIAYASTALAQSSVLQGGPWAPGHVPAYSGPQGGWQPVVQDGGPAAGGPQGTGISEVGLIARGTGTPPFIGQGTGPFGTNFCDYDAPTNNPTGYHFLCWSANAASGGLIAYGPGGVAAALPLRLNLNGTVYEFPFNIGGIGGPTTSTIGNVVTWNNTTGSLVADSGIPSASLVTDSGGRPFCNPRAKGALGNGSADDTAAFMSCVTALDAVGGGVMVVDSGNYCLKTNTRDGAAAVIDHSQIIVKGAGAQSTFLNACSTNITPIELNWGYAELADVLVIGDYLPATSNRPAILMNGAHGGFQRLNHVNAQWGYNTIVTNSTDCLITDTNVQQSYGDSSWHNQTNGCRVTSGSFDSGFPVITPVWGQVTVGSWASNTYFGSSFTATISTTTMTVSAVANGALAVGELVNGAGVAPGTQILAQLTGSAGSTGTYTVSVSQTITPGEAMMGTGDLVTSAGYTIQLATAGTSSSSNPTVQGFGTPMTDGSAVWQLVEQNGYAAVRCSSCGEMSIQAADMSTGAYYSLIMEGSAHAISLNQVTISGLFAAINAVGGSTLSVTGSHDNGVGVAGVADFAFGASFLGEVTFSGNPLLGNGNQAGPVFNITGGTGYSFVGNGIYSAGIGILVAANINGVTATGNAFNAVTTALNVQAGTSTGIVFADNIMNGATISIGAGATVFAVDNPNYNPVQTVKTTSFSAATADCGTTILLEGGSFYTVTIGAASNFGKCQIWLTNTDTADGKNMAVNGLATQILYPTVTWLLESDGTSWRIKGASPSALIGPAWRPNAPVTLYAAPSGVDTNDCLSSSRPCTLTHICAISNNFDTTALGAGVNMQLADGTYNESGTTPICSLLGDNGGAGVALRNIIGNIVTPTNVVLNANNSGSNIFTKDGAQVEIEGVHFQGGSNAVGYSGAQFTIVDLLGDDFGTYGSGSFHIGGSQLASINIDGPYSISGSAPFHVSLAADVSLLISAGTVVTIPNALAFTDFLLNYGGFANIGNWSFTGAGAAGTTGAKFRQLAGGCLLTGGTNPNTYLLGNSNGTIPVSACADFPLMFNWADLPCSVLLNGQLFGILDSNTATWGALITGTGANQVTGRCNQPAGGFTVEGK